jgi:hypothetical protein
VVMCATDYLCILWWSGQGFQAVVATAAQQAFLVCECVCVCVCVYVEYSVVLGRQLHVLSFRCRNITHVGSIHTFKDFKRMNCF